MRGAVTIAWIVQRKRLLWLSVITILLTWLLAAPIGPIRDGVLRLVSETPFLQKLVGGVMGLELSGPLTVKLLVGSTWAHPFLLAVTWGFAVLGAGRFPAAEIEDGTIDTLLAQPVSRFTALAANSVVVLLGLVQLVLLALVGFHFGCRNLGQDAPAVVEMLPVALSLWASSVLVLGLATLASVHARERAQVNGPLLAVILGSLLLAYLKPFLPATERFAPLGLLHYYKPGEILQSGQWPWPSIVGLLSAAFLVWLFAAYRLQHRDL